MTEQKNDEYGVHIGVSTCAYEAKGKVCGESITQGVLNPERWFHTARMFDLRNVRLPEKHQAVFRG